MARRKDWIARLVLGVLLVSFTHFVYRQASRLGRAPAKLVLFVSSALYAYVLMLLIGPLLISQAAKLQPLVWSWFPEAGNYLKIGSLAFLFLSLWYGSGQLLSKGFEFLDWSRRKAEGARGFWARTAARLKGLKS